ncbi:hypothetical protein DW974_17525 [Lachnospiraceae bacterium AM48-27BH]|nr:hypothetical protein DW974_17525 [Lachnospiraceae bacterium AM48-27BH]
MNKAIKKFAILAGIFLAAAGIYFFTSLNNMEQSETVYTVMDAPELPVIEAELFEDQPTVWWATHRIWEMRWPETV